MVPRAAGTLDDTSFVKPTRNILCTSLDANHARHAEFPTWVESAGRCTIAPNVGLYPTVDPLRQLSNVDINQYNSATPPSLLFVGR